MSHFSECRAAGNAPIERGERILDAAVRGDYRALRAEGTADEVSLLFTRYCHNLTIREARRAHQWAIWTLDTLGPRNAATEWDYYVIGNIARDTNRPYQED